MHAGKKLADFNLAVERHTAKFSIYTVYLYMYFKYKKGAVLNNFPMIFGGRGNTASLGGGT